MKIRTDLRAGYTSYAECDAVRNAWKAASNKMEVCANGGACPTSYPSNTGGIVGGVYYPDYSGYCSTGTVPPTTPPPTQPPTSGGGYVGGVYYPDKSGYC